jgi:molybdopterin/thiamine biosynthesis adenylyltransferase
VRVVGHRYSFFGAAAPLRPELARQALAFGDELSRTVSSLTFGVVGCGGTGSAVAMLLARLGATKFVLVDPDRVELTNLNRLHGARKEDANLARLKVDVVSRHIESIREDAMVARCPTAANDQSCWSMIKSCDVVFGCTDDNRGRLFLNRLAYFYILPVIDIGLAIEVSADVPPRILALDGRVTCLGPNEVCLLCREVINLRRAREESLQHSDPNEYARQKQEAYVIGEGNPSPSVVTFTTEVATMAINELIHRIQGFRGPEGSTASRTRQFHRNHDLRPGNASAEDCPVCGSSLYWGMGDTKPFLDQVW